MPISLLSLNSVIFLFIHFSSFLVSSSLSEQFNLRKSRFLNEVSEDCSFEEVFKLFRSVDFLGILLKSPFFRLGCVLFYFLLVSIFFLFVSHILKTIVSLLLVDKYNITTIVDQMLVMHDKHV